MLARLKAKHLASSQAHAPKRHVVFVHLRGYLAWHQLYQREVMSMAAAVSMCAQPLGQMVYGWAYDQMPVAIVLFITTALFAGDTTAVMGGTLLIGVCFVLINNLTDLLVRATDPRVR